MKNGKCIQCGSDQIFKYRGYGYNGYRNVLQIALWRAAVLTDYVCAKCGYLESYLEDPKKIDLIKCKWKRVTVAK